VIKGEIRKRSVWDRRSGAVREVRSSDLCTDVTQGKHTINEYLDEFKALVRHSRYREKLGIVIKFCHGLNHKIHDKIAESGPLRPDNEQPDLWYEAAQLLD
jgi:hypothetical protein